MLSKSIVILCLGAMVASGFPQSEGPIAKKLHEGLQDGLQRQNKAMVAEQRQTRVPEDRQLIPADVYSIDNWAETFDYWSRLMGRSVLPIVTDLMETNVGRQAEFLRPFTEFLPEMAQFLHTASLILSALTNFLRATALALTSEVPRNVQIAITAAEAARRVYN